jgi:hypothetical protein
MDSGVRSEESDGMNGLAPVVIFSYRRPDHLRRTIEGLMRCEEFAQSPVIVYCDGPRNEQERSSVLATQEVAKLLLGDRAEYHFRDINQGLARSVIAGVTDAVSRFGRVIVVEDDLLVSPYFLRYMNEGLVLYENEAKVASIHAYLYPTQDAMPETFFLRGANCWGWATWARAWSVLNENGAQLAQAMKQQRLVSKFDLDGSYPYFRMLLGQIAGNNNSWAVRWHASTFLAGMLTLYPGRTLVENIGMDGSGEHCRQSIPTLPLAATPILLERIPVEENQIARMSIIKYMRYLRGHLWRGRARRVLSWILRGGKGRI